MTTLLDFEPLFQEDVASIRSRMDADANRDIPMYDPRWIDTREGSFYFDVTQPVVLEFARIYDALATEVPAAAFASFAWGVFLDLHAEIFGLERKDAVAAGGTVNFVGDPGTPVGVGSAVGTEPDENGDSIEFVTTESGVVGAQIAQPTGLTGTPSGSGGTLASATYQYAVAAINAFGETLPSAQVPVVVVGPAGSVALDWNDVAGATGYRVYRSVAAGDFGGRVYEGALSSFTDTGVAAGVAASDIDTTGGVALTVEASEAGSAGNVSALAISDIISPLPGIDEVANPAETVGGTDIELDEELRERVLLEYEGRGDGLINDYRRWALEEPGVGRVFVNPTWQGPGTVQVVVMTATGDPVAPTVVDSLQERLDPTVGTSEGLAPPGSTVTVQTPDAISIDVSATLTLAAGFSIDGGGGTTAVRSAVEQALADYVDNLDVGEDVIYNHLVAQFFGVKGVVNYTGAPTVNGGTADVAVGVDPPEVAQLGTVALS